MALSFTKLFQPSALGTSAASIYQVPAAPATSLLRNGRVRLTNNATAAAAVSLYAVPAGTTTATTTNAFLPGVSIAANQALEVDVPQLAAGDAIYAVCGVANAVNSQAMDGVLQS